MDRETNEERLLREYVKRILTEMDDGFVSSMDGGSPYGVSWGSGEDLISTFVTPFVDVFKTAAGKSKEIVERTKTLVFVALQTILTTLIPIYGYNYAEVFDKEKEKIDKIRGQYKEVYDRTENALNFGDAGMLAFMASPALFIGSIAAKKGPGVAKEVLGAATGGISDIVYDKIKKKAIEAGRWSLGEDDKKIDEANLFENDEKKITPQVVISYLLKNQKVISRLEGLQKVSTETYRSSLKEVYNQAVDLMKNAKTLDDLEKIAKKKIPEANEVRNLQGEEKIKAEKMLINKVREGMKKFYVDNLTQQMNKAKNGEISVDGQYVKDYEDVIKKINAL